MNYEKIIKTENLTYSYSSNDQDLPLVLDGINIEIGTGDFVAILGHNGSGKSTLARQLNAILLPEGGKVYIDGMDTQNESLVTEIRKTVGLIFQNPDNQIVSSVVEEDVAFAPENLGIDPDEIRRRVDESLALVDMLEYKNHAPHRLSGGQKQRVAIAGVLAMQPRCIVLDEPTAMLDPVGRREVINTITQLSHEKDITVVLITHHMSETVGADRLIVMSDGRVEMDGTPREIFKQVNRLNELGLAVPDSAELLFRLRREGLNINSDAITPEECAEILYSALTN